MAEAQGNVGLEPPQPPRRARYPVDRWATRSDFRSAALIVVVLAVAGALLGLIWQDISPRTKGFVYLPNAIIPQENESLVATDGRFVLLTAAVGVVVAVAAWLHRSSRGPVVAVALAAGSLLGALLTEVVGQATGGGESGGALNATITMQVSVHARGLLFVEAVLALLIYEMCVVFSKRDDLGRAGDVGYAGASLPAPSGFPPATTSWPSQTLGPDQ